MYLSKLKLGRVHAPPQASPHPHPVPSVKCREEFEFKVFHTALVETQSFQFVTHGREGERAARVCGDANESPSMGPTWRVKANEAGGQRGTAAIGRGKKDGEEQGEGQGEGQTRGGAE